MLGPEEEGSMQQGDRAILLVPRRAGGFAVTGPGFYVQDEEPQRVLGWARELSLTGCHTVNAVPPTVKCLESRQISRRIGGSLSTP
jgi:hypothetical protein